MATIQDFHSIIQRTENHHYLDCIPHQQTNHTDTQTHTFNNLFFGYKPIASAHRHQSRRREIGKKNLPFQR